MNLNHYVKLSHGRQSFIAKAINAQPQLVYQWANGIRPIPIHHCVSIERVTGGVVTRRDLRPSDWWKIWPELVDGAGAGSRPLRSGGVGDCSDCSGACGSDADGAGGGSGGAGGGSGGDMSEEG